MTPNVNNVLPPGTIFHGRYRVVRAIKAGSMGAVYEVVDHKTDSRRALKVMLPGLVGDPDLRARFVQEAKITGGLESDHIVRVLDAGVDERSGTPFLVMDLLRGEELGRIVKRSGPLAHVDVGNFLFQAALALDKTHAAGIVHRDLKPQNLFLTYRDDGSPCVKIFDFGIAKVFAHRDAHATKAIGTPLYMAPEQIRGDSSLGPQVDIYALGQIAFTLLTGEPYWNEELKAAGTIYPLLSRIVEGVHEPPSARAARRFGITLPPGFDAWFMRATASRPEARFDRASDAVAELSEVLGVPGLRAPTSDPSVAQWARLPRSDPAPRGAGSNPGHGSGSGPKLGVSTHPSAARGTGSGPQINGTAAFPAELGDSSAPTDPAGGSGRNARTLTPRVEMSMAASARQIDPRRRAGAAVAIGAVIVMLIGGAAFLMLAPGPPSVAASAAAPPPVAAPPASATGAPAPPDALEPPPPPIEVPDVPSEPAAADPDRSEEVLRPPPAATQKPAVRPPAPKRRTAPAPERPPTRSIF